MIVLELIFYLDHFGSEMKFFFRKTSLKSGLFPPRLLVNEGVVVWRCRRFPKIWRLNIKQTEKVTPFWSKQNEWSSVKGIDPRSSRSKKKPLDACYEHGCHWQKLANSGQWPKIGRLRKGPFFWAEKKGRWVLRSLHEVGAVFVEGGKKVGGSKTCLCYASDSGWWWRDQISEVCSTWFFRNFSTW